MSWREQRAAGWVFVLSLAVGACQTSYPYLILNDECRCEEYHYNDPAGVSITIKARYKVGDAISSRIEITIENRSSDSLDLRQAFIKGTSRNVRYAANNRFLPLPHVVILPGKDYDLALEGQDVDRADDPWLKIAGEQVTIEIRKMYLSGKELQPAVFRLVPKNPKLGA